MYAVLIIIIIIIIIKFLSENAISKVSKKLCVHTRSLQKYKKLLIVASCWTINDTMQNI